MTLSDARGRVKKRKNNSLRRLRHAFNGIATFLAFYERHYASMAIFRAAAYRRAKFRTVKRVTHDKKVPPIDSPTVDL